MSSSGIHGVGVSVVCGCVSGMWMCLLVVVETGSSKSPAFRVMTKWGNWVWTRALKECTYDPVTHKPNGMVIYLWLVG